MLTRQWVLLTLACLALVPAMVRLGLWQYHRYEQRVAQNELIGANLAAPATPVQRLSRPGTPRPVSDTHRHATAIGRYDSAHQSLVRRRTAADGETIGFHVLTPLILGNGDRVLVNRGWIPGGGGLTAAPKVPAAPAGEVTVTGRLRPDETTASSGIKDIKGLPKDQVLLINSDMQSRVLRAPVLSGYLELTRTSPEPAADQPELIPEPDHGSIGPHVGYAYNWWFFAAMVPVGWGILVRRERRDRSNPRPAPNPPASPT